MDLPEFSCVDIYEKELAGYFQYSIHFYQYALLATLDQQDHAQKVGFPVKNDCPENISLFNLKTYQENNSPYDFIIKENDIYIRFQLKSVAEKYQGEFTTRYFIDDINHQTSKYKDKEMILVYLLQPSNPRNTIQERDAFHKIIEDIYHGIAHDLPVRNIFLTVRYDSTYHAYFQVFKEFKIYKIPVTQTLHEEIKKQRPFRET